jgi:ABC-type nickel/cobalt efflux system permease component RcnA
VPFCPGVARDIIIYRIRKESTVYVYDCHASLYGDVLSFFVLFVRLFVCRAAYLVVIYSSGPTTSKQLIVHSHTHTHTHARTHAHTHTHTRAHTHTVNKSHTNRKKKDKEIRIFRTTTRFQDF